MQQDFLYLLVVNITSELPETAAVRPCSPTEPARYTHAVCARHVWFDESPAALSAEAQTAHCEVLFNEQLALSGGHWAAMCRGPGPRGQVCAWREDPGLRRPLPAIWAADVGRCQGPLPPTLLSTCGAWEGVTGRDPLLLLTQSSLR